MPITQTYQGAAGVNFFTSDALVRAILAERLPASRREAAMADLEAFGGLCGGRLAELIETAHRPENLPRLVRYDRWGNRIDEISYCREQVEARRLAMEGGILPPAPLLERMTKAYLLNQNGEGGITCPLAMTDGLIELLRERGTERQKKAYLPVLSDSSVAVPLTAGQFVTEKQGGSTVSENETVAEERPDGTWRLSGVKWFCSNPGELWVTTAKPKGSDQVALFLMPRTLADGTLNACHTLRLKDLSGTRGKATAEVEYQGAYAESIGRPSHGLAILLGSVLRTSRIHVSFASLGFMRRAVLEAELFCGRRIVMGRPAARLGHVAATLAGMKADLAAATLAVYEMLRAVSENDPAAEALVPLLKIEVSAAATSIVRRARLLFAGNGVLNDFSILPRLAEDALIQEIWEGTGPVLDGHFRKALRRSRSREAFLPLLAGGPHDTTARAYHSLTQALLRRAAGSPLDAHSDFAKSADLREVGNPAVAG